MYCVESVHCECTARADADCTPSELVAIINSHPIISAFFHGHEHILAWTHMDSTRVSTLTGSFEQFITSPAGLPVSHTAFSDRLDYHSTDISTAFGLISVDGLSFTVGLYHVGTLSPVWSRTFTKGNLRTSYRSQAANDGWVLEFLPDQQRGRLKEQSGGHVQARR